MSPVISDALHWLRETDEASLDELWQRADAMRREYVGDAVHLRGLLEVSNYCDRLCLYCGLRRSNDRVVRYRMTPAEILAAAREAVARGYGTVVMQAGEDPGLDLDEFCRILRRIKAETPLAITLSLGELDDDALRALKQAGADRYLLRFETSNESLLRSIHPPKAGQTRVERLPLLGRLRDMGFEVGSGVMIGIPGQTLGDLARDIAMFQQLDLDMIGVGPYIPHPDTPLHASVVGGAARAWSVNLAGRTEGEPARGDELTTYKMIALTRIACPRANIPSTTALATINPRQGQVLGLQRGANVIMPNLTPEKYRRDYQIYPNKAGSEKSPDESEMVAREELLVLGRPIASGRGDSRNLLYRRRMLADEEVE